MTKHTRRVLELGAGLALALTVVLTAYADWHQRTAARVRADTVRLHILANSDTWDDQLLKLQVRDAVLAALPPAVTQAQSPQQAVRALQTAQQRGIIHLLGLIHMKKRIGRRPRHRKISFHFYAAYLAAKG